MITVRCEACKGGLFREYGRIYCINCGRECYSTGKVKPHQPNPEGPVRGEYHFRNPKPVIINWEDEKCNPI